MPALRDAQSELGVWRTSPLRPLLEDAMANVPAEELVAIAKEVEAATSKLGQLRPVRELEETLRQDVAGLAGTTQDIKAKFGFAPTDPLRIFRSIGLFIDDGRRALGDASLGSANLALLALRLAEFEWRKTKKERNYTLLCVEEPEAHLHPHLQRTIFKRLFQPERERDRSLIMTTHSPNIASVAPLSSIVVLRTEGGGSRGYSLASLKLSADEIEDLQRYINTTRADLLFSRGAILVEGDAEAALLPVLAQSVGYDLDELGIAVCNVAGVNFAPYVKLVASLGMPYAVITDWDDVTPGKPPLGKARAWTLIAVRREARGKEPVKPEKMAVIDARPDDEFRRTVRTAGVFLNASTLEVEIAATAALRNPLIEVLEAENFGPTRTRRLADWKAGTIPVDGEQLLAMIADVGKGRLAGRLAGKAAGLQPPEYIKAAIEHVLSIV